jgi:hypothetical protein
VKHLKPGRAFVATVLALLATAGAHAQLWRLQPDVSFSTGGLGWEPIDTAIAAGGYLGAADGGYVRVGYGFALDADYYLILPELESAVRAFAGYELLSAGPTGFSPDGAAGGASETTGPYRGYRRFYADVGLDQILAGDRRIGSSWLMLSAGDVSRYVEPRPTIVESAAPEAFFTHAPYARLSFRLGPMRPFWETAALSGGAGAVLEAGHSPSRGAWAFLMGDANLGFKLPVVGKYLYLHASAGLSALALNLSPGAPVPAWSYSGYADAASLGGGLDLKCRALEWNPMVPLALEFGVGAGAGVKASELAALQPLAAAPVLRAFVDLAVEGDPLGNLRLRVGAEFDPATGAVWFLFRTVE